MAVRLLVPGMFPGLHCFYHPSLPAYALRWYLTYNIRVGGIWAMFSHWKVPDLGSASIANLAIGRPVAEATHGRASTTVDSIK